MQAHHLIYQSQPSHNPQPPLVSLYIVITPFNIILPLKRVVPRPEYRFDHRRSLAVPFRLIHPLCLLLPPHLLLVSHLITELHIAFFVMTTRHLFLFFTLSYNLV